MAGGSGDMGLPGVWDCSGFTLFQLCYIGAQIFPHCSIHHMYSADIGGTLCNQGGEVTPGGSNTDYRWAPGPPCAAEQRREILFPCHLVVSRR